MRVVHLADLHLGFRRYSRTNKNGINCREADVFKAFREALSKVKALRPDLLLIAGDVFHVTRPNNLTVIETQKVLLNFVQTTGIETIVIAGNHESIKTKDNTCILELLSLIDGVKVVCRGAEIVVSSCGAMRIACLPHNSLVEADYLDLRPDGAFQFNLLMLHGTVDGSLVNDHGGKDVPPDLLQMDWDYVACGHFHSYRHIDRFIYYAGATDRTSNDIWKEAEEDKGFIEFDLESKKAFFHPLPTRKTIDFPIIDAQDQPIEVIDTLIADHVRQTDITDAVVRQKVINLAKSSQNQLNYRQVRTFQATALHYELNCAPPVVKNDRESSPDKQRGGLYEEAEQFLQVLSISNEVCRETFVAKGLDYLQRTMG